MLHLTGAERIRAVDLLDNIEGFAPQLGVERLCLECDGDYFILAADVGSLDVGNSYHLCFYSVAVHLALKYRAVADDIGVGGEQQQRGDSHGHEL